LEDERQHGAHLPAAAHEMIEIREDIEDNVQPRQAQETNDERLDELPQQVPVDNMP
jgi:hypothetical protein